MHETAIAEGIIKEARKHGDVVSIVLDIGELAHVPGEELIECLKRLVDWKITWTERPAKARCSCGFSGHPEVLERGHDHFMIECPDCGETPDLEDGTEVRIVSVKVN
ncbi:MAG: hydrogenase/urease maturation nickel metallochaperone HypA [Nanoarchaeota archaeon]